MYYHLLTVTRTFFLPKYGLLLQPALVKVGSASASGSANLPDEWWPEYPRLPLVSPDQVELRYPDGTTEVVRCRIVSEHVNYRDHVSDQPPGFKPPWVEEVCCLPMIGKDAVPIGTEVWYDVPTE